MPYHFSPLFRVCHICYFDLRSCIYMKVWSFRSFLKNFQKRGRGYCNSEVLVIIYVLFAVTELHFDTKMQASRQSIKAYQGSGPIGSALSTGFQIYLSKCWDPYVSPGCLIQLAFFWVFLPCYCMSILSLPLLGLDSKSTSLNPGFCVFRSMQCDTICWKLDLIPGLFVFSWLIVLGR